ncbi:MAG: nucleotidyltransferase domain-containing protein [Opitutales bacterium]|jgi:predicted nucleotidyltransferase
MNKPDLREKDLETLRRTFRRFPFVREVKLFGSRANGTARRDSDIDLAIHAPEASAREWAELAEAIENTSIIHEVDVVRTDVTESQGLGKRIGRDGVGIYCK